MCFTGGFALAAAVEPAVLAPVASQPSVPFPLGGARKRDLCISDADRDVVAGRVAQGLCLVGLRFPQDSAAPGTGSRPCMQRSATAGGSSRSAPATGTRPGRGSFAHNVLTYKDVEQPGHPTNEARRQVVEFLKERLTG